MSMVQEKMYMDVDDVCAILGVSKAYAYNLMREYNKELKANIMTAITDDNPVANLRFFTFLSLAKTISFKISCSFCPISILYLTIIRISFKHFNDISILPQVCVQNVGFLILRSNNLIE